MGAKEYDPITKRADSGFVTASVIDPFGNILGIMHNPHYAAGVGFILGVMVKGGGERTDLVRITR